MKQFRSQLFVHISFEPLCTSQNLFLPSIATSYIVSHATASTYLHINSIISSHPIHQSQPTHTSTTLSLHFINHSTQPLKLKTPDDQDLNITTRNLTATKSQTLTSIPSANMSTQYQYQTGMPSKASGSAFEQAQSAFAASRAVLDEKRFLQ